jgi:hypothetical protein
VSFTVKWPTTTVLSSSSNPSTYGQSITFTAAVTSGATGTVAFIEGATSYCSGSPIIGTTATCGISALSVGPHTITATYGGDPSHEGSSGTVEQIVNKANQLTLTLIAGSPLTYNTTETLSTSGGSGTGAVSYEVTSGSCSIANGDQLAAQSGSGTCSITATKAADENYHAITASATVVLQKAVTETRVEADVALSLPSPTVTMTATVSSPSGSPSSGTVRFRQWSEDIPGCETTPVTSGSAVCTTTSLRPAVYEIAAVYSGDLNYASSTSQTLQVSTLLGRMSRNSWYLSPEGWIVRAYTRTEAPQEVYIEVLDAGGNMVDAADISGMQENPMLIAGDAAAPDVSLGMDRPTRTGFVIYRTKAGGKVVPVPGIMQAVP